MDNIKIGQLIYRLRKEKMMTQKELARQLYVSDKAISKWERGLGCPDISLLSDLSNIFQVNIDKILKGEISQNLSVGGNMKNIQFYVCSKCGNVIISLNRTEISCCDRQMESLVVSQQTIDYSIEDIEGESFISFKHAMTKDNYLSFVVYVEYDRYVFVKLYPEQAAEVRISQLRRGKLYCYGIQEGLMLLNK